MVFLFQFTSTAFDAEGFANVIRQIEKNFAYPYTPTYVLGNHDRMRYITRFGNDKVKARLLATLQLTLRGVPFIYYGEEIGMENVKFKLNTSEDPIGRKFWWLPISQIKQMGFSLTRDGCRTPMQWDQTPNAGFSPNNNAKPWLRIPENYNDINVFQQQKDSKSLLNCYKALIRIRKENIALHTGMLEFINTNISETHCLGYKRVYGEQEIVIYLNFSNDIQRVPVPNKEFELLFSTIPNRKKIQQEIKNNIVLIGYEALILKIKNIDR
jgi:oligo-1,6-glucosidase/alpha-glucosidase